jgi:hypothetical protein
MTDFQVYAQAVNPGPGSHGKKCGVQDAQSMKA